MQLLKEMILLMDNTKQKNDINNNTQGTREKF
jgi:hypothetical protein